MIHIAFAYEPGLGSLRMRVQGHAGAAKKGEDLICASASMLAYTLGQAVCMLYEQRMLRRKPRIYIKEGCAEIIASPREGCLAEALMAFWTVQAGALVLSRNYPQFVTLDPAEV